ncbi:hypothetical protein LC593_29750 [Nostoc sp. CHAB 5844]|nr:hypothetical protein [Nostoc sp. CHAB 5844]
MHKNIKPANILIHPVQIQAYASQSRFQEAMAIARNAVKEFNIYLPEQATTADIALLTFRSFFF